MYKLLTYLLLVTNVNAATINDVGDNLGKQMNAVAEVLFTISFVAGLGFLLATFFKLKQHKDNPAQNPIGNTVMYFVIATLLLYLGAFADVVSQTMGIS